MKKRNNNGNNSDNKNLLSVEICKHLVTTEKADTFAVRSKAQFRGDASAVTNLLKWNWVGLYSGLERKNGIRITEILFLE